MVLAKDEDIYLCVDGGSRRASHLLLQDREGQGLEGV